jgi:NAD(P)-dependent dehydrogenase (short-subunit alcohol dehydrogenase family)
MAAEYPDLAGKLVLITGGASGIGEAVVRAFAGQNAVVAFLDVQDERGQDLAAELSERGVSAHFRRTDVTDIETLQSKINELVGTLGPVNALVHNAAYDERHGAEVLTKRDQRSVQAVSKDRRFWRLNSFDGSP